MCELWGFGLDAYPLWRGQAAGVRNLPAAVPTALLARARPLPDFLERLPQG